MDFHELNRKSLQQLCKKHGIPANLKNVEMADRLSSLLLKEVKPEKAEKRGKSCLKSMNEAVEVGDDDRVVIVDSKEVKKVRFSPENQTFLFEKTDPRAMRLLSRKKREFGNSRKEENPEIVSCNLNDVDRVEKNVGRRNVRRKSVVVSEGVGFNSENDEKGEKLGVEGGKLERNLRPRKGKGKLDSPEAVSLMSLSGVDKVENAVKGRNLGRSLRKSMVGVEDMSMVSDNVDEVEKMPVKRGIMDRKLRSEGKGKDNGAGVVQFLPTCEDTKAVKGRKGTRIVEEGTDEGHDRPPKETAVHGGNDGRVTRRQLRTREVASDYLEDDISNSTNQKKRGRPTKSLRPVKKVNAFSNTNTSISKGEEYDGNKNEHAMESFTHHSFEMVLDNKGRKSGRRKTMIVKRQDISEDSIKKPVDLGADHFPEINEQYQAIQGNIAKKGRKDTEEEEEEGKIVNHGGNDRTVTMMQLRSRVVVIKDLEAGDVCDSKNLKQGVWSRKSLRPVEKVKAISHTSSSKGEGCNKNPNEDVMENHTHQSLQTVLGNKSRKGDRRKTLIVKQQDFTKDSTKKPDVVGADLLPERSLPEIDGQYQATENPLHTGEKANRFDKATSQSSPSSSQQLPMARDSLKLNACKEVKGVAVKAPDFNEVNVQTPAIVDSPPRFSENGADSGANKVQECLDSVASSDYDLNHKNAPPPSNLINGTPKSLSLCSMSASDVSESEELHGDVRVSEAFESIEQSSKEENQPEESSSLSKKDENAIGNVINVNDLQSDCNQNGFNHKLVTMLLTQGCERNTCSVEKPDITETDNVSTEDLVLGDSIPGGTLPESRKPEIEGRLRTFFEKSFVVVENYHAIRDSFLVEQNTESFLEAVPLSSNSSFKLGVACKTLPLMNFREEKSSVMEVAERAELNVQTPANYDASTHLLQMTNDSEANKVRIIPFESIDGVFQEEHATTPLFVNNDIPSLRSELARYDSSISEQLEHFGLKHLFIEDISFNSDESKGLGFKRDDGADKFHNKRSMAVDSLCVQLSDDDEPQIVDFTNACTVSVSREPEIAGASEHYRGTEGSIQLDPKKDILENATLLSPKDSVQLVMEHEMAVSEICTEGKRTLENICQRPEVNSQTSVEYDCSLPSVKHNSDTGGNVLEIPLKMFDVADCTFQVENETSPLSICKDCPSLRSMEALYDNLSNCKDFTSSAQHLISVDEIFRAGESKGLECKRDGSEQAGEPMVNGSLSEQVGDDNERQIMDFTEVCREPELADKTEPFLATGDSKDSKIEDVTQLSPSSSVELSLTREKTQSEECFEENVTNDMTSENAHMYYLTPEKEYVPTVMPENNTVPSLRPMEVLDDKSMIEHLEHFKNGRTFDLNLQHLSEGCEKKVTEGCEEIGTNITTSENAKLNFLTPGKDNALPSSVIEKNVNVSSLRFIEVQCDKSTIEQLEQMSVDRTFKSSLKDIFPQNDILYTEENKDANSEVGDGAKDLLDTGSVMLVEKNKVESLLSEEVADDDEGQSTDNINANNGQISVQLEQSSIDRTYGSSLKYLSSENDILYTEETKGANSDAGGGAKDLLVTGAVMQVEETKVKGLLSEKVADHDEDHSTDNIDTNNELMAVLLANKECTPVSKEFASGGSIAECGASISKQPVVAEHYHATGDCFQSKHKEEMFEEATHLSIKGSVQLFVSQDMMQSVISSEVKGTLEKIFERTDVNSKTSAKNDYSLFTPPIVLGEIENRKSFSSIVDHNHLDTSEPFDCSSANQLIRANGEALNMTAPEGQRMENEIFQSNVVFVMTPDSENEMDGTMLDYNPLTTDNLTVQQTEYVEDAPSMWVFDTIPCVSGEGKVDDRRVESPSIVKGLDSMETVMLLPDGAADCSCKRPISDSDFSLNTSFSLQPEIVGVLNPISGSIDNEGETSKQRSKVNIACSINSNKMEYMALLDRPTFKLTEDIVNSIQPNVQDLVSDDILMNSDEEKGQKFENALTITEYNAVDSGENEGCSVSSEDKKHSANLDSCITDLKPKDTREEFQAAESVPYTPQEEINHRFDNLCDTFMAQASDSWKLDHKDKGNLVEIHHEETSELFCKDINDSITCQNQAEFSYGKSVQGNCVADIAENAVLAIGESRTFGGTMKVDEIDESPGLVNFKDIVVVHHEIAVLNDGSGNKLLAEADSDVTGKQGRCQHLMKIRHSLDSRITQQKLQNGNENQADDEAHSVQVDAGNMANFQLATKQSEDLENFPNESNERSNDDTYIPYEKSPYSGARRQYTRDQGSSQLRQGTNKEEDVELWRNPKLENVKISGYELLLERADNPLTSPSGGIGLDPATADTEELGYYTNTNVRRDVDEKDNTDAPNDDDILLKRQNRSILIHGTPRKPLLPINDMKENMASHKLSQITVLANATATKPLSKRKALGNIWP